MVLFRLTSAQFLQTPLRLLFIEIPIPIRRDGFDIPRSIDDRNYWVHPPRRIVHHKAGFR